MAKHDWFTEFFGATVKDIREKVVEEPWFGRALSNENDRKPAYDGSRDASLNEMLGWGLTDKDREKAAEPEQDKDHGIDR